MVQKFKGRQSEYSAIRKISNLSSLSTSDESFRRWTSYYFDALTNWIYLVRERGEIVGYLMGCPDSFAARNFYRGRVRSFEVYADLFAAFPGHLHMNCHPRARGRGFGSQLIQAFLRDHGRPAHIVTAGNQRNVLFYRKNGFTLEVERSYRGYPLLFMGCENSVARPHSRWPDSPIIPPP